MKYCNHTNRRKGGMSLLELLAVVTILGSIAVVVIPRISFSAAAAKTNVHLQNVAELNTAIERYHLDTGSYPSADLSELGSFLPDGIPKDPRSNPPSDYTMSTTTNRVPRT